MQAGRLNRRCTLQSPSQSVDAIGQPTPGWTDVATVWANIKVENGMEHIRANADTAVNKVSIRVRYRTDLTAAMRVQHGSTVYQIKSVLADVDGREYTDLVCEVSSGQN